MKTTPKNSPLSLPQATDLEQAVLGALMIESSAYGKISDLLWAEHFYNAQHALIYQAIQELESAGSPIDMLLVGQKLKAMGKYEQAGEFFYLAELSSKVSSAANIQFHARIIIECYARREIIRLAYATAKDTLDASNDLFDAIYGLQCNLDNLSRIGSASSSVNAAHLAANESIAFDKRVNKPLEIIGTSSGFSELDDLTMGWQPQHLVIIAGRPGMGKTAFMLELMRNAAKTGNTVGIISLEMSNEQLMQRLILNEAQADSKRFRQGKSYEQEKENIAKAIQFIGNLRLEFYNSVETKFAKIRQFIRKTKAEKGIKIFFIDYLQLIVADDLKTNREQQVSYIATSLAELAKHENICIVALCQLSRSVDDRKDKRPMLSDLRESGAIEQAANMILFLYRPEYYKILQDANGNSTLGQCQVDVAKNKDGACGEINLSFTAATQRFHSEQRSQFTPTNSLIPMSQALDENPPF